MFLQSSKSIGKEIKKRSKILTAAMEVDEDYKRYRAELYSQAEKKISVYDYTYLYYYFSQSTYQ